MAVLASLPCPSPRPCVPRAACGGSSRPGAPYPRPPVWHSMRSVHSESSVRLPLWYSLCALCVCVRSRSRGVPLPGSVWRPDSAWFQCRAPVGLFHAVRAPPRFLPRSRALSGLLGGGGAGGPVSFPPYLALGCVPPRGQARFGAGAACVPPPPPGNVAGGPQGARNHSTSVSPSASPGRAARQVAAASLSSVRAWSPYCSPSCPRADPGCGPRGVPVRRRGTASLSRSLQEQAGGGVGARGVWA